MKRKAISTRTRFEIFKRDGFACQYCGATPPNVLLHVDHITPVSKGGKNHADNLITACQGCNLGKSDIPLSVVPKSLKEKAEEVAEREKQIQGYNAILQDKRDRIEEEAWSVAACLQGVEFLESYSKSRLASIRVFLERLPFVKVLEAAEKTEGKFHSITDGAFRYFCGICWAKIKDEANG